MITEFTEKSIKTDTENILFWIKRARLYLEHGNARMAANALNNTTSWLLSLVCIQTRLESNDAKIDWEEIFKACDNTAQEKLTKGDF